MIKKCVSILLVFLLLGSLCATVYADEESESREGFSIEELPAFGEEDIVTFTNEDPQPSDPTTDPDSSEGITSEEDLPDNQPETLPEEGDAVEDIASPDPDTAQETPEQSNLPVIITIVVLAATAIAALLLKKRKTLGDRK